LLRHRIQVVLVEYGHIATIIRETCEELGIPLVVHFHGNDASHRPTLELLKEEYRSLFEYASAIISVSQAMTVRLRRLGAPADKIVFNCYGIDTELFNNQPGATVDTVAGHAAGHVPGHAAGRQMEPATFVAVGRFVEKKAPHLTILAFAMAKEQNPSIRLIMIGNGPLFESCRQVARAIGIEECIEFAGVRTPAEISSILSRARAFVQHSVIASDGNAEGTPLSVLEAGACGVPVIGTRHEGITDVVIANETGILVDEFDVRGMARAIEYLATDAEAAARMGRTAREHIRHHYTLDRHIDILKQVILDSYRSTGPSRIQA
jgi:glycosyltransferase involved in cell wall biosynthesis